MAQSRVKTWSSAEVLTASDLNAEFNNILNNALAVISPLTGDLDLSNQRLDNLHLGTVGDPSISFNSDANTGFWSSAADEVAVTSGGVEGQVWAAGITVINDDSADYDFRVEGANNANMLSSDAGTDSIALGGAVIAGAFYAIRGSAQSRGHASTIGYGIEIPAATYTDSGNSALAHHHYMALGLPTISTTNTTGTTSAATLYIEGAPAVAGGGAITNPYALHVDAGTSRFDGFVDATGAGVATIQSTDNVHDTTPTNAELDTAFGTPATVGRGFLGTIDDASGETNAYLCFSSDNEWFFLKFTKAA